MGLTLECGTNTKCCGQSSNFTYFGIKGWISPPIPLVIKIVCYEENGTNKYSGWLFFSAAFYKFIQKSVSRTYAPGISNYLVVLVKCIVVLVS